MKKIPRSFRDKFHEIAFMAWFRRATMRRERRQRYGFISHVGKRQAQRLFLQDAHHNQLNSHLPGTVQPRHIFGAGQ